MYDDFWLVVGKLARFLGQYEVAHSNSIILGDLDICPENLA
jgi:hypothetical protein